MGHIELDHRQMKNSVPFSVRPARRSFIFISVGGNGNPSSLFELQMAQGVGHAWLNHQKITMSNSVRGKSRQSPKDESEGRLAWIPFVRDETISLAFIRRSTGSHQL